MELKKVKIKSLKSHPKNYNQHPDSQISELEKSLDEFGQVKNIVIWHNQVIAGNGLLAAAKKQGQVELEVQDVSEWDEQKAISFMIADNQLAALAVANDDMLAELLKGFDKPVEIPGINEDFLEGLDLGGEGLSNVNEKGRLVDDFIVPPFSIFDTKREYWIERKRYWMGRIGDAGESRRDTLSNVHIPDTYHSGKGLTHVSPNVSLLDPVLSEIVIKWFGIKKSNVFDCFAGDTIFGYVSSFLGNNFTGIELRQEQVNLNQKRCDFDKLPAQYFCDDGRKVGEYIKPKTQDLFFSCPPYYDLEKYSDFKNDASNQNTYEEFYKIIDEAFVNSIACLKEDRFAIIVCGDVRNKKTGGYYDLPGDIKNTFLKKNMVLYNEIILAERIGTACMKAANYMKNRKIVKTHQNILVFYKGNTKKIKNNFPKLTNLNKERIELIASKNME